MSFDDRTAFVFPEFGPPLPANPEDPISESFDADADGSRPFEDDEAGERESRIVVRQRVAQVEKEAYEKAFLVGEKAGREFGENAAAPLVEKLGRYLEELSSLRERLLREAERELTELAFQMARAVVSAGIEANPEAVRENARKAIGKISREGRVTLRVHPADVDAVFGNRDALAPFLEGRGELRVEADDAIERGGCLAVTDFSEADATISGQFAVLRERLAKAGEKRG
jgi:flagellar biosynthesis/type III secretory pathway protein FliH